MTAEEARNALYLRREKVRREDWNNGEYWEINPDSGEVNQALVNDPNSRWRVSIYEQVQEFQKVGYSWEKVD